MYQSWKLYKCFCHTRDRLVEQCWYYQSAFWESSANFYRTYATTLSITFTISMSDVYLHIFISLNCRLTVFELYFVPWERSRVSCKIQQCVVEHTTVQHTTGLSPYLCVSKCGLLQNRDHVSIGTYSGGGGDFSRGGAILKNLGGQDLKFWQHLQ